MSAVVHGGAGMNRRDALAMLAAGATMAAGWPAAGQQAGRNVQPKVARKGRIKQGLWKTTFGEDTKLSFDDMCREAARLGAYGFDLIDPAEWPTLRKYGLQPLLAGAGPVTFDNAIQGMTIVEGGAGQDTFGVINTNAFDRATLLNTSPGPLPTAS